jgi:tetratricopeptide (TPR) repeat protein
MIGFKLRNLVWVGAMLCWADLLVGIDYPAEYRKIRDCGDDLKIEAFLDAWQQSVPGDPEVYITKSNHYFSRFQATAGDLQKPDPTASDGNRLRNYRTAEAVLREGVKRFPERLDMALGLAFLCHSGGDHQGLFATLASTLAVAKARPEQIRWKNGRRPDQPLDAFLPSAIRGYLKFYFGRATPLDEQHGMRLAQLLLEYYPQDATTREWIADSYLANRDYPNALTHFIKCYELRPENARFLMPIARCCLQLGDKSRARFYLEKIITLGQPPESVAEARELLKKIGT